MPKKPQRNPSHLAFPKSGAVHRVDEELPREQENLELAVGQRFVDSLKHFHCIDLGVLSRGDEPADLHCSGCQGESVSIQLAELVDERLRQLQQMRVSYRDAAVEALGADALLFNGCRVSLADTSEPPYWPPVHTRAGRACAQGLTDYLRSVALSADTIGLQRVRVRKTTIGKPARDVAVRVERKAAHSDPPAFQICWSGAGPGYKATDSRGLVEIIAKKVQMHYSKPRGVRFLLLVYSVDTLLTASDDGVFTKARDHLDRNPHPFDEVWYFYPYAQQPLGHVVRVWPTKVA